MRVAIFVLLKLLLIFVGSNDIKKLPHDDFELFYQDEDVEIWHPEGYEPRKIILLDSIFD